jgi:hypothetical protein
MELARLQHPEYFLLKNTSTRKPDAQAALQLLG